MTDINYDEMHEIQDVKQTGCGMVIAKFAALAAATIGTAVFSAFLAIKALEALWTS